MAGYVERIREMKHIYRIFVGTAEVKRPPGRPRRRWEDNNRIDLREIGWENVEWMHLA
jgi:hypothetical protein